MSTKALKADEILRSWALEFHESGDYDDSIKIVFDGYLEDDDGLTDESQPCYAIFVHKDSLSGKFPPQDDSNGFIAHRSDQEVCFYVWLNLETDEEQEINEPDTDLNIEDFYDIIIAIEEKYS
jgi:hypothetical protein